jgi:signal transduction histidine kinase
MKHQHLLTLTSRKYMLAFLALLAIFFGVFYFIMRMEVLISINEILFNRKSNLIKEFNSSNGNIPFEQFKFTDFKISETRDQIADTYSDTLIYEPTDQEYDEYRKLVTTFDHDDKRYKLEIVKAHLESDEIISTVLLSLALMFLLMLAVFYFMTRYFAGRIWQPFQNTLNRLNVFEPEKTGAIPYEESRIIEFNSLNKSIHELTARVHQSFLSQKQFIENASHEMQTPLAIIQSQSELLITDSALTENQSEKMKRILDSTQRITKLNKALQLISKIENAQFIDIEQCDLKKTVEKILSYFDGQQENLNIAVDLDLKFVVVSANSTLVEVLITNLIKNAFLHNVLNGKIQIILTERTLSIINTSSQTELPKDRLFQRFFKQGQNRESWGLGLAISKRICEINNWTLSYAASETEHTFVIDFTNNTSS